MSDDKCVRCRSVTYGWTYYVYRSFGDLPSYVSWRSGVDVACCRALYGNEYERRSIPREHVTDLCASIAQHVIDHAVELVSGAVDGAILCGFGESELRYWAEHLENVVPFMRRVRFVDGKPQWYSIALGKISCDPEKRYDTRWREVTRDLDGGAAGILARVTEDAHGCLLEELSAAVAIRNIVLRSERTLLDNPCELCRVDRWKSWDTLQALRGLEYATDVLRGLYAARGTVDCWTRNTEELRAAAHEEQR